MNRVSFASLKSTQHMNFAQKTPSSSKSSRNKSISARSFQLSNFPTFRNTVKPIPQTPRNFTYRGLLSNIDEDANFTGLEDGKLTKLLYNKFTFIENAVAFLSLTGMILAVLNVSLSIFYRIRFSKYDMTQGFGEGKEMSLIFLMSSTTIILCVCLVLRHILKLNLSIARGKKARNDTLFTSGQIYFLLLDFAIALPHPSFIFTGLTYTSYSPKEDSDINYSINELFSFIIHIRIILIFRAILNMTIYTQPRAYRICCIYDAEFGYLYAVKALIKRYPIIFLLILIAVSTIIFSHAVRVCEKPFDFTHQNNKMDIGYWPNAFWVVIVTIYTIGYGDYYPRSNLGRFVLFFVEIWGNFLISMMVVAIGNLLLLDSAETKALCLILRLEKRKIVKIEAASVIASVYKIRLGVIKKTITKSYKRDHLIKIKTHLELLKKYNRISKLKQKNDGVTTFELLAKNFENFMNDLRNFQENQDKIMKKYQSMEHTNSLIPTSFGRKSINNQGNLAFSFNHNSMMNDSLIRRRDFKNTKSENL